MVPVTVKAKPLVPSATDVVPRLVSVGTGDTTELKLPCQVKTYWTDALVSVLPLNPTLAMLPTKEGIFRIALKVGDVACVVVSWTVHVRFVPS